jgi:hypothetical protein
MVLQQTRGKKQTVSVICRDVIIEKFSKQFFRVMSENTAQADAEQVSTDPPRDHVVIL